MDYLPGARDGRVCGRPAVSSPRRMRCWLALERYYGPFQDSRGHSQCTQRTAFQPPVAKSAWSCARADSGTRRRTWRRWRRLPHGRRHRCVLAGENLGPHGNRIEHARHASCWVTLDPDAAGVLVRKSRHLCATGTLRALRPDCAGSGSVRLRAGAGRHRACTRSGARPRVYVPPDDHEALRDTLERVARTTTCCASGWPHAPWRRARQFTPQALRAPVHGPLQAAPMRFALFYHSLISDWNHGNAHFLRGVCCGAARPGTFGPGVRAGQRLELAQPPRGAGRRAARGFPATPIRSCAASSYEPEDLDLDSVLADRRHRDRPRMERSEARRTDRPAPRGCSLSPAVPRHSPSCGERAAGVDGIRPVGVRRRAGLRRCSATDLPGARLGAPCLDLARGGRYADFSSRRTSPREEPLDLVWVGNWGDDERTRELREFLIEPVHALGAACTDLRRSLSRRRRWRSSRRAGIEYAGWIANFRGARVLRKRTPTVHVPRRFYREQLPGHSDYPGV